ncbi:MAG TPA: hypothetical protein VFG32_05390 [Bacteroidota bacterium]|nr:hypothetical protein [Bacteroidota bacterium]
MSELDQHLQNINDIRTMMERSSKMLSLSGLSGVSAGVVAIAGVLFAQWVHTRVPPEDVVMYIILDALVVLVLGVGMAAVFSLRMARKKGLPVWTPTSRFLIVDLAIPLGAGGLFCIALLQHGNVPLIPGTMLVFYGLALINGSKYALKEIRYLGITELMLGCIAIFLPGEGLNIWALGFGMMHILYGSLMYFRYER